MTYEKFCTTYSDRYSSDIKWGEMDAMQHLNNTFYFRYFECARMVFWDRLERETRKRVDSQIGPILASTSCRFRRPLYYPDKIEVGACVLTVAEDRFTLGHAIWSEREQSIAADGDAVIVSFDYSLKQKVQLPLAWKSLIDLALGKSGALED